MPQSGHVLAGSSARRSGHRMHGHGRPDSERLQQDDGDRCIGARLRARRAGCVRTRGKPLVRRHRREPRSGPSRPTFRPGMQGRSPHVLPVQGPGRTLQPASGVQERRGLCVGRVRDLSGALRVPSAPPCLCRGRGLVQAAACGVREAATNPRERTSPGASRAEVQPLPRAHRSSAGAAESRHLCSGGLRRDLTRPAQRSVWTGSACRCGSHCTTALSREPRLGPTQPRTATEQIAQARDVAAVHPEV